MNFLSKLPIEKILNNDKIMLSILRKIESELLKKIDGSDICRISFQNDKAYIISAKQVGNSREFWEIEQDEFFDIGLPLKFTDIIQKIGNGKLSDFLTEKDFIYLENRNGNLFVSVYSENKEIKSGSFNELVLSFIKDEKFNLSKIKNIL